MTKIFTKKMLLISAGMVLMLLAGIVYADEVEDSVKEAMEYYTEGDFSSAAGSLEYAAQLIRQKKGGELESFLPQPLPGWTAQDASSQAMGAAMFGGGVTAERAFTKGDSNVTVQIVTDSPMLQGMMMMFTNPMFAASDGGKLEKINRQKAIVKYTDGTRQGDIKIMVANRFLIMVEGQDVTKDDLKAYAGAIDFKKMAAMQ
jgi:hypothetical protein